MLEAKIQGIMDRYHAVSVSVYAGKRGETIFQKAVGLKNPETGEKTDIDTIYRSASVSKHVSAMTAMTLVDKGLLDIDEDISTYLGYTVRNPWHKDVPITCRQLKTFSSTLHERGNYNAIMAGKLPPYKLSEILPEGAPGYTEANFAREIPGAKVDYSSFCIGILGTVVEKVTGMRFAEYARKAILEPLGVRGSFDPRDLEASQIAVPCEMSRASSRPYGDAEASDPEWMKKSLENKLRLMDLPVGESYRTAQGNLYIVPGDLYLIDRVLMQGGVSNGRRILSESSVKEIMTIQKHDEVTHNGIGLCMAFPEELQEDGVRAGFAGRAYGVLSGFLLLPEQDAEIICYCNGAECDDYRYGCTAVCADIIEEIGRSLGLI